MTTTDPSPGPEPPEPGRPRERAERPAKPEHLNARPSWDCTVCGEPWPCSTARADLLEEFRRFPSVLTIYMSAQMYDALTDLVSTNKLTPGNLFERFIAWSRPASTDGVGFEQFDHHDLLGKRPTDPNEAFAA